MVPHGNISRQTGRRARRALTIPVAALSNFTEFAIPLSCLILIEGRGARVADALSFAALFFPLGGATKTATVVPYQKEVTMSVNVTWLSHACLSIDTGDAKLLVDPFLTGNPLAPVAPDDVQADYILVSHGHGDHVGDTVAIARRTGATVISNFEIHNWLLGQGVEKAHPQHIGGGFDYPWGRVKLTIAHHGSALPDGSYGGNPCGFLFYIQGKKIYHACDTGLFYDMKLIGEEGIDLAVLPIGDNFTMGPEDSLRAVKLLSPKRVLPIHYDTFDVIQQDAAAWKIRVEQETDAQVDLLKPGESLSL
jgi:L-ascorbate metabolism protein UlaG (beta-lactamase superfamily)